jgi:hypothetical protein
MAGTVAASLNDLLAAHSSALFTVLPDSSLERVLDAVRRLGLRVFNHVRFDSNSNHVLLESCSAMRLIKAYPALIDRIVREGGAYYVQRMCYSLDALPSLVSELVDEDEWTLRLYTYPKHTQADMLTLLGQKDNLRLLLKPNEATHQLSIIQLAEDLYLVGTTALSRAICAANPICNLDILHDYRLIRQTVASDEPTQPETVVCRAQLKLAELFEGSPARIDLPTGWWYCVLA